jgi:hypothetical protein
MVLCQAFWIGLAIGTITVGQAGQEKPPIDVSSMVVEYLPPPNSLEEAVSRSDAIVRVRVRSLKYVERVEQGSPVADTHTVYSLLLTDVIKTAPTRPLPTEVWRMGGDVVTNRGIKRILEQDFPAFEIGSEYVLFLIWNQHLGAYQIAFGPNAAFQITVDDRIHALGNAALARRYHGGTARELSSSIRQILKPRLNKRPDVPAR